MNDIRQTIERFLETSREPVLSEPGEETIALTADNFLLEADHGGLLRLQVWNDRRNLVRRITGIEQEARGKLVLRIERFAKRAGLLCLIDLGRSPREHVTLRGARLEFREVFRRFLRRQFPLYKVVELTTEADLEHSLSPAYPRALLRQGASAWAAIGASTDASHAEGVLSFGLIWLDYLRRREPALTIHGLILYLPAGHEKSTCLRLLFLEPRTAEFMAFVYNQDSLEQRIDLRDYGNLDTRLEPCRRPIPSGLDGIVGGLTENPDITVVERSDGERSLRVHGMEFARTAGSELLFGLEKRRAMRPSNAGQLPVLARELSRLRAAGADDRLNPLYLRNPEAWLESEVRNHIEQIDARLLASPIYGQVPAFAATDRGVLDLLAIDRTGRLTVLELKASEDIHLPLQALDYWMRVKWHLDRHEFSRKGYFPQRELRNDPPRLLLVSPALDFHPSNERVLQFLSPDIPVERVGVGLEWRKGLKVMFRSSTARTSSKPGASKECGHVYPGLSKYQGSYRQPEP